MLSKSSAARVAHVCALLVVVAGVTFGRAGDARADACLWSYPVGTAPSSPAPAKDGHPVGGTNLPQYGAHLGSDFWQGGSCADLGKPVYAAADGVVAEIADALGSYLDVVVLRHDDPEIGTVYTMYGHIARAASLAVGQTVTRRQQLGTVGNVLPFGFSPCHLHFEILSPNAFDKGPFCSGCAAAKINVSPGYDQKRGVTKGTHPTSGDTFLEVNDAIQDNRWYIGESFLARRVTRTCGADADAGTPSPKGPPEEVPPAKSDPDSDGGGSADPSSPSSNAADMDPPDAGSCSAGPVGLAGGGLPLLLAAVAAASARRRRAAQRGRAVRGNFRQ